MKALLVGDIHLSDRPPSIRTDEYTDDILAKLEQTVQLAEKSKVDAVVWAGDVFHLKSPSRTSHGLVRRTAEIGQLYNCPWLIVPGNHDISHDRLESLTRQPLGVLFKAGAIPLIGDVAAGEFKAFGIPWLNDWQQGLVDWMGMWEEASDSYLMVTHAPIMPPGVTQPYEYIDATDWARLMGHPGSAVYYGHIHDVHGTYTVEGVTFCNQGALSRGSIHESSLVRKPAVTLFDSEATPVFKRIEIEHRPAEDVFRLVDKKVEDDRADRLDEFLLSVKETQLEAISIEAVMAHIESLGLSPETREEIVSCLEVVQR